MDKKRRHQTDRRPTAPGIDPEEAYGESASENDIEKGESTEVTKFKYDEYDPSEK